LAACRGAPMMQIDHVYYTDLTRARVDEILDQLE
jgi:NADH-quinone oxidoreductase subunit E